MLRISNQKAQNLVQLPQYQTTLAETQTCSPFIRYNLDVTSDSQWFIAHTNNKTRIHLPYVQELGEFEAHQNYMTTRQGLQSYLLKVTEDGSGYLNYDGKHYSLSRNQFFWIDCRKIHYYATEPTSSNWHVIWIHFWGCATQNYYETFIESNNGSPIGTLKNHDVIAMIRKLIASYSMDIFNDYQTDIKAASMLTSIMTNCIESVVQEQKNALNIKPPKVIPEIQDYIVQHYNEKLTLDSLALEFFIDKFYLQKQFHLYVGCTPSEYQRSIRIEKAKELLRVTNLSINDISNQLGFESVSYFIRRFKNEEGTTPLQYRKEWCT